MKSVIFIVAFGILSLRVLLKGRVCAIRVEWSVFVVRLYCGFERFPKTNKIFSKWHQEKVTAIDNEREKQVQLTNNPKKNMLPKFHM